MIGIISWYPIERVSYWRVIVVFEKIKLVRCSLGNYTKYLQ